MGSAAIFNGEYIKLLKSQLKLKDNARILTGTDDPTAVAKDGETGSIYLRQALNTVVPEAISALGTGINSNTSEAVECIAVYNNEVYVGGSFTTANGAPANYFAKWNGTSWVSVGTVNNRVIALKVYNNELYLGGNFSNINGVTGASYLAKWNGTTFSTVGGGSNFSNIVATLEVYNSELYIGGYFSSGGGVSGADYIVKWNESAFSLVGPASSLNSQVRALAVYGSDLYIGGNFTNSGGFISTYFVRWNGSSFSVAGSGTAFNGQVLALASYSGKLYIGGSFTGNGDRVRLTSWDGTGYAPLSGITLSGTAVYALISHSNSLYIGGNFSDAFGVTGASDLVRYDGTSFYKVGASNAFNSTSGVLAFASNGSTLYIGGYFNSVDGAANTGKVVSYTPSYTISTPAKIYTKTDVGITTNWKELVDTFNDQTVGGNKTFTGLLNSLTVNQDRGIKLIEGGTWTYTSSSPSNQVTNLTGSTSTISYVSPTGAGNSAVGQSFTPSSAFIPSSLVVSLLRFNSPTGNVRIDIYNDNAGTPGSVIASSSEIAASSIPTSATDTTFTFSVPVLLSASTLYYFMLVAGTGYTSDSNNAIGTAGALSNVYAGGQVVYRQNNTGAWATAASDTRFNIIGYLQQLSFDATAYIQVPGLPNVRNSITTAQSPITITNGQVAYVNINRTGTASSNLTVSVANIEAVDPLNSNLVIIARGASDGVFVGTSTDKLASGQSSTLESIGTILANVTTAALKVTQTGTGDAILVEDQASDATPFVVKADGKIVIGHTDPILIGSTTNIRPLNILGTSLATTGLASAAFSSGSDFPVIILGKSKGSTIGDYTAVQNNDTLGEVVFAGSDGTDLSGQAAAIRGAVDGTVATDSIPGRLIFTTTASGGTSATERMRIDNQGSVGIGSTSLTGYSFRIEKTLTGAGTARGISYEGQIQPDVYDARNITSATNIAAPTTVTAGSFVTGSYYKIVSLGNTNFNLIGASASPYVGEIFIATGAGSGTGTATTVVGSVIHMFSTQGTLQSGATLVNQYGFYASSNLTGASNNYGFYGNIAAGTSVTAGSFVIGKTYKITAIGTTDFTLIGAASNTVGLTFTATGVGSGTGAAQESRYNFFANGTAENRFNGNTVIDTSSNIDALRVTQRGGGNALVVEDSTNPDSTPFVIDASGKKIQGSTSGVTLEIGSTSYGAISDQLIGSDGNTSTRSAVTYNATFYPSLALARSYGGTQAAPVSVPDSAGLGRVTFLGYDSVGFKESAKIEGISDAAFTAGSTPGRIVFSTTASGSTTPTERVRIDSTGAVTIAQEVYTGTNAGAAVPLTKGVEIEDLTSVQPTLDIDFTSKAGIPSSLTLTRNSVGKYYDGYTTSLAEQNLQPASEDFSNATYWTSSGYPVTVSTNVTTAPNGTTTADSLTETVDNLGHTIFTVTGLIGVLNGQTYAVSVFLKKGNGTTAPDIMQLTLRASGFASSSYANFNINTGTVVGGDTANATIVNYGNGWYRCILTAIATSTGTTNVGIAIAFCNNNASATKLPSYVGQTTSNVFVWGAQFEQRATASAYTATTTSAITNYQPTLLEAAANEYRLDFDPITRQPKGILIEEQRTNLLTYSEDFSNAIWNKSNISIQSNLMIAPDGTLTADSLIGNSGSSAKTTYVNYSTTTVGLYTISIFLKAGTEQFVVLRLSDQTGSTNCSHVRFDLLNGTMTSITTVGANTAASSTITNVGNGWYRVSLTTTFVSALTAIQTTLFLNQYGATSNTTNFYAWGAQLEAAPFATSYIKTVASQQTRAADALTELTGSNLTSWFNNSEGTLYAQAGTFATSATGDSSNSRYGIATFRATSSHGIGITGADNASNVYFTNRDLLDLDELAASGITKPNLFSIIGTYDITNNTIAASLNGAAVVESTTATAKPVIDKFYIGNAVLQGSSVTTQYTNGWIKRIIYWPEKLDNTTIRNISAVGNQ